MKLVRGIGINNRTVKASIDGKDVIEYSLWTNMLARVYVKTNLERQPAYTGCSVSDDFKYYHIFHEWCQTQIGFSKKDYQLDKDLLVKGNKIYSKDTCVFIPKTLNSLIIRCTASRGLYPVGVAKHRNKFTAYCRGIDSIKVNLGTFDTPELAFQAYKVFKEAHIKELAELYKDSIDPRAYNALINYTVELDD